MAAFDHRCLGWVPVAGRSLGRAVVVVLVVASALCVGGDTTTIPLTTTTTTTQTATTAAPTTTTMTWPLLTTDVPLPLDQECAESELYGLTGSCSQEEADLSTLYANATEAQRSALECFTDLNCISSTLSLFRALQVIEPLLEQYHVLDDMCEDGCYTRVMALVERCVKWEQLTVSKASVLALLQFGCIKNDDNVLCTNVFSGAITAGTVDATAIVTKCQDLQNLDCSNECAEELQGLFDATGCCGMTLVDLLAPLVAEEASVPITAAMLLDLCGIAKEPDCKMTFASGTAVDEHSSPVFMYAGLAFVGFVALLLAVVAMYRRFALAKTGLDMIGCLSPSSPHAYELVPSDEL